MPPRIGIERRDAHEAMHARFGLQPAIGVLALDQEGRALDARLLAVGDIDDLDLELPPLGPARIHAHEHVGPILALRAAGARMHLEEAVIAVGFAGEQGLDLLAARAIRDRRDGLLALLDRALIAFGLAELDQHSGIIELALERADRQDARLEIRPLAHQKLRLGGIVPEGRALRKRVQLGKALLCLVPVKDASSAIRWIAWRLRVGSRFRRA